MPRPAATYGRAPRGWKWASFGSTATWAVSCPGTAVSWPRGICTARTLPPQKLATSIKAPTSPYLIQDFILLLPSRWPLPLLWQAGPFISGQKIGGICEEKMRLCEAKVKMVKIASSLHVCMKSNLQASLSPYLYSDGKSGNQYPDKAANRNKIPPHPL